MKDLVVLFADGSCLGNPGPGGWAAVLGIINADGHHEEMVSGNAPYSTNNQMELQAVLGGLKALKVPSSVTIVTDSANVIGWLTGKFKIKNPNIGELCKQINSVIQSNNHTVLFEKVTGHSGVNWNERADKEAVRQARIALNSSISNQLKEENVG